MKEVLYVFLSFPTDHIINRTCLVVERLLPEAAKDLVRQAKKVFSDEKSAGEVSHIFDHNITAPDNSIFLGSGASFLVGDLRDSQEAVEGPGDFHWVLFMVTL